MAAPAEHQRAVPIPASNAVRRPSPGRTRGGERVSVQETTTVHQRPVSRTQISSGGGTKPLVRLTNHGAGESQSWRNGRRLQANRRPRRPPRTRHHPAAGTTPATANVSRVWSSKYGITTDISGGGRSHPGHRPFLPRRSDRDEFGGHLEQRVRPSGCIILSGAALVRQSAVRRTARFEDVLQGRPAAESVPQRMSSLEWKSCFRRSAGQ